MAVFCPKHRKELQVEQVFLNVSKIKRLVIVGACPQCDTRYVNRALFLAGSSFSVDGIKYEVLSEMEHAFPHDREKETLLIEEDLNRVRKAEEERRRLEEQRAKRESKRQKELQQKKKKDEEVEKLRASLLQNPKQIYRPAFISYYVDPPEVCPYDSEPLMVLQNIRKKGIQTEEGLCCIRCSRLFLPKAEKKSHSKPISPKTKATKKTSQADSFEVPKKKNIAEKYIKLPVHIDNPPESTILVAHLLTDKVGPIGSMAIVSNEHEQDSSRGIYWVGRALPSIVLAAIQTTTNHKFVYKGNKYRIAQFDPYKDATRFLEIISRFCNPESPQTIYVFSQKNIDRYKGSDYEEVTAMIPCENSTFPVPVTVIYEKKSKTYFINEVSYDLIRARYGLPYLRLRLIEHETSTGKFAHLRSQSMLNKYGYNVNAVENLSMEIRHRLLSAIIDTNTLSKAEVINHLEWLINTRRRMDHMENAVGEWKSDLIYVSNYRIDRQRSIWAKTFIPRHPR